MADKQNRKKEISVRQAKRHEFSRKVKSRQNRPMKNGRLITFVVTAWSLAAGTLQAESSAEAVYINGNIYTVNDRQPHAEAIAVKGRRLIFVGSNADAEKYTKEAGRVIDLRGQTVEPGMTDAHCHIFGIGAREMNLNLEDTGSLDDFLARVKERVRQTPPGQWRAVLRG